jgi:hypothetical protein
MTMESSIRARPNHRGRIVASSALTTRRDEERAVTPLADDVHRHRDHSTDVARLGLLHARFPVQIRALADLPAKLLKVLA